MSDSDPRRGGLAERRDPCRQGALAANERRGGAAAHRAVSAREPESMRVGALPMEGGEMGDRIRAHDWAATPLGPVEGWPACLKNALEIVLRSPVPMSIFWGERGVLLYNDATIPMLGAFHPGVLGTSLLDAWPEYAERNNRMLQQVLAGESLSLPGQQMETVRNGTNESAWFDFDYSPIVDKDGRSLGVLQVARETTA